MQNSIALLARTPSNMYNATPTPLSQPPPRRTSDIARIIEVFGNTRGRKQFRDPRAREPVEGLPAELRAIYIMTLKDRVDEMFESTAPFNDPTADLSYENHKYQHTKEEWHKIIDIAVSRIICHNPEQQFLQRNMPCWLSMAQHRNKHDVYPHIKIGKYLTRVHKYLYFLYATPEQRQDIWDHVGETTWHCSHMCHNKICINPNHMVFEWCGSNVRRARSCEVNWTNPAIQEYRPCPASHRPNCLLMDHKTGIMTLPEFNYRKHIMTLKDDDDDSETDPQDGVYTYEEMNLDKISGGIKSLMKNWAALPGVESVWERQRASIFESQAATYYVAFGNYRIRKRQEAQRAAQRQVPIMPSEAAAAAAMPMDMSD